jgi:serine/threonine-protein kinase RsbW
MGGTGMRLTMDVSMRREAAAANRGRYLLDGLLWLSDVAEECRIELGVLITEACANAAVHADRDGPIEVSVSIDEGTCVLEVGNRGSGMSDDRFAASMPGPLAESGRGLPLIAALADSAGFTCPRPGWVVLRITKCLVFVDRAAGDGLPAGIRTPRQ